MTLGPGQLRALSVVVVLMACWLVLETALWLMFRVLPSNIAFLDPDRWTVSLQSIRDQNPQFDPELGWIPKGSTRIGYRRHAPLEGAAIAAFGDSFTFGDEVGDSETWEARLAKRLGSDVLNYGVGGYGIDQALLRYEAYLPSAPRRHVILAFISENINRNVNVYRKFYYPKTAATFTKPRFVMSASRLTLKPNPVQALQDRDRLADGGFIRKLGSDDYWFNHRHLPTLRFPYTRLLFDRLFWRQLLPGGRVNPSDLDAAPDFTLWTDAAARDLTIAIFERFVTDAIRHGDVPVILHLPVEGEIRARQSRGELPAAVEILAPVCTARHWQCLFPVLEAGKLFPDASDLFSRGGHYNASGNDRIAAYLASALTSH